MSNGGDEFRGLLEAMNDLYKPVEEAEQVRETGEEEYPMMFDWKDNPEEVVAIINDSLMQYGLRIVFSDDNDGDNYFAKITKRK